ncbi:MAG: hypothetical protein ACLFWG_00180 [Longimicrobiales bacterium]
MPGGLMETEREIRKRLAVLDSTLEPDDERVEYRLRLRVDSGPGPVVRVRAATLTEARLRALLYFLLTFPWLDPDARRLLWRM